MCHTLYKSLSYRHGESFCNINLRTLSRVGACLFACELLCVQVHLYAHVLRACMSARMPEYTRVCGPVRLRDMSELQVQSDSIINLRAH